MCVCVFARAHTRDLYPCICADAHVHTCEGVRAYRNANGVHVYACSAYMIKKSRACFKALKKKVVQGTGGVEGGGGNSVAPDKL